MVIEYRMIITATFANAADRVYIVTTYTGGLSKASAKVPVQSVVGAVLSIAIRDAQP